MKELLKRIFTGLTLTFGFVALGALIVTVSSHNTVDSHVSKPDVKETLNYTEMTMAEAEKEVEKAEAKVESTNKEVEKAEANLVEAKNKVEETTKMVEEAKEDEAKATAQVTEAKKEKEAAEAELQSATTAEAKKTAQAKVDQAEKEVKEATQAQEEASKKVEEANKAAEEAERAKKAAEEAQRKALEAAREAEEARLKAQEEANRLREEAERQAQEEANRLKQEAEKKAQEGANKASDEQKEENIKEVESTQSTLTDNKNTDNNSTVEQDREVTNETNNIQLLINAAQKTKNAKSLTVYDITNKWTKKYDKNNARELITYYSGSSASNGRSGVLYSYSADPSSGKQKSLFKEMSTTIWNVPSATSIKNGTNIWEMQFSGKRTVGVPELNLLGKGIQSVELYSAAATLVTDSAHKLLQNVSYYKVKLTTDNVKTWLGTYYNTNDVTDLNNGQKQVEILVGLSNGYVTYISNVNNNNFKGFEIMVGQNGNKTAGKYLKFELVLANAGRTTIPTEEEVGLSDDSVKKLEEEYKAHYGCKRENDYWVCKP